MAQDFDLAEIREILRDCEEYEPGHHLGRPFMSAYQIAIRFAHRFPNHHLVQILQVGGAETGEYQSLAQRIARFLSGELRPQNPNFGIEGGFLSHDRIHDLRFKDFDRSLIQVSTLDSKEGHAIFRYVGNEPGR